MLFKMPPTPYWCLGPPRLLRRHFRSLKQVWKGARCLVQSWRAAQTWVRACIAPHHDKWPKFIPWKSDVLTTKFMLRAISLFLLNYKNVTCFVLTKVILEFYMYILLVSYTCRVFLFEYKLILCFLSYEN